MPLVGRRLCVPSGAHHTSIGAGQKWSPLRHVRYPHLASGCRVPRSDGPNQRLQSRDDTTTRTEVETAGSGKIWVSGFGPGSRPLQVAPYASGGPHPSPAASPATVEEPRARTKSRCASERRAPVA
eukprot:scaffold66598_cov66-Phaeocystis_antarctica.AAC.3